jgi:hypothetical protein
MRRASFTFGGTMVETSPPKCANSFTKDEERNEWVGAVAINIVSTFI